METDRLSDALYLRGILDALPAPLFVVDAGVCMLDMNRAAAEFIEAEADMLGHRLCGEVLRCARLLQAGTACGKTPHCPQCPLRQAILSAHAGRPVIRRWARMQLLIDGRQRDVCFLASATAFESKGAPLVVLQLEDVTDLAELRALLPICSGCGKIRSGDDYWHSVQDYLRKHTPLQFSHGLCPECAAAMTGPGGDASGKELPPTGQGKNPQQ
jgi:hypothetical protein